MLLQRETLKKFTELNNTESKKMAKYVKDNTILDWREYGDDFGKKACIENKFLKDIQFEA